MDAASRRQREKLERRYQIMDAAERVFLQTGVEHATMDHIARAANVSKGSLYLCFKDRDDLYLSIAQRAIDDLIEREEEVQEQMVGASGYEWFETGLRCYVRYALEYQNRFRVAMSWLFAEEPIDDSCAAYTDYQLGVSRAFQFGIEALELGKLDGSVRPELETSQTVFSMWGGLVGLLLMLSNVAAARRRIPFEVDYEGALEMHLEHVLQSIKAQPPPISEHSAVRMVGRQRQSGS